MKTSNSNLLAGNVLTISEMFNVRGGDGDEGTGNTNTTATTTGTTVDIIL